MKVLHVAAGNLFGGVETILLTLARLREQGAPMQPHFAVCFPGRLRNELAATGVPVHDLGSVRFRKPWTVWSARRRMRQLLNSERFDVVVCHSSWTHSLFAPVARRTGCPIVFWAHGISDGVNWSERLARRTPPDLVLANSRFTAGRVPTLFPGTPTEVVYLPVPSPETGDRMSVRRELGTPADAVVIVTACRMEECKGHHVLIEALRRMRELTGWTCWIAGGAQRPREQSYQAGLVAACRAGGIADRVRFLGQRADVARLLSAADIYCQPNSAPESFGVAFVEALYAGLPVVTSAVGGALEIVNETCGVLLPPGDFDALSAALMGLIDDANHRRQLGATGPLRAVELCDPSRQLNQLAGCLAERTVSQATAAVTAAVRNEWSR